MKVIESFFSKAYRNRIERSKYAVFKGLGRSKARESKRAPIERQESAEAATVSLSAPSLPLPSSHIHPHTHTQPSGVSQLAEVFVWLVCPNSAICNVGVTQIDDLCSGQKRPEVETQGTTGRTSGSNKFLSFSKTIATENFLFGKRRPRTRREDFRITIFCK